MKLCKADRFSIKEGNVDAFVPGKIEEVTGFDDYKDKVYQHRSTVVGGGQAYYHGHAKGEEEKKQEVQRFLRHAERQDGDEDLLNFAAIRAFLSNGNLYLMEPEEMPDQNKASPTLQPTTY